MNISRAQCSNLLEACCRGSLRGFQVFQSLMIKIQFLWKRLYIVLVKCFEWIKNRFTSSSSRRMNPLDSAKKINQLENSALALTSFKRVGMRNQATELRAALLGILTFFTRPSNVKCIDDESGKDKLTFYDIIFFKKHADQMRFENPSASFSIASLVDRFHKSRGTSEKAKEWGYDRAYFLSDPKEMRAWGFSDKDAKSVHVIAFTYKEVISEPKRIEEIFD